MVIWDLDGQGKSQAIPTGDFEPEWLVWKSDRRLITGLRFFSLRNNTPTFDSRLLALDADGRNIINLVQAALFKGYIPQHQDQVVSFLPSDKDHILIELPSVERGAQQPSNGTGVAQFGDLDSRIKYPELVKVDINTGKLVTVAHPYGRVVHWQSDATGRARVGRAIHFGTVSYQVQKPDSNVWRTVQSHELNRGRIFTPVGFIEGNDDRLFVLSNHEGGSANLYEFDVPSDSFVRTIAASPKGAVSAIARNGQLLGYFVPGSPSPSPVYLDPVLARESSVISRAMPDSTNTIIDRSDDGKRVLVRVTKHNGPPAYWLLDRSGSQSVLSPVAETYPAIDPSQVAVTHIISYKARDGLEVPALLTLPPLYGSGLPGQPLPFIVLPHGGPNSRDSPAFDYRVQFLASRGYGVLQPQFRGSTGYGAAFEAAGHQQWGLSIQDDITDGTQWLIRQNLADPARIAIVGTGDFAGYAALMGTIKEPDLYRCAVAIAPVTDLKLLIERQGKFLFGEDNIRRIGSDSSLLEKTSPAQNVQAIKVPLLLVHGRKDYTVPVAQTERLEEALKKAGKSADVVYLDEADHYLSRGNDRQVTLKLLEKFLGANL